MLNFLTARGLSVARIHLIPGHKNRWNLEVYRHHSLDAVAEAYQEVMKSLGV